MYVGLKEGISSSWTKCPTLHQKSPNNQIPVVPEPRNTIAIALWWNFLWVAGGKRTSQPTTCAAVCKNMNVCMYTLNLCIWKLHLIDFKAELIDMYCLQLPHVDTSLKKHLRLFPRHLLARPRKTLSYLISSVNNRQKNQMVNFQCRTLKHDFNT